ncbi:hypothetical protein V6667_07360 [Neisseria leonii]|uniref:Uncharacterized protein n=1 Tax=Neisseria leonii TaxID=2995413 RepID=A0A9X4IDB4_9NEIS|nr:hypothetical protein [Neisseria sp. 51.81]MDD9327521.1 hypothetical protein [Neisseria sp. 51.81]
MAQEAFAEGRLNRPTRTPTASCRTAGVRAVPLGSRRVKVWCQIRCRFHFTGKGTLVENDSLPLKPRPIGKCIFFSRMPVQYVCQILSIVGFENPAYVCPKSDSGIQQMTAWYLSYRICSSPGK